MIFYVVKKFVSNGLFKSTDPNIYVLFAEGYRPSLFTPELLMYSLLGQRELLALSGLHKCSVSFTTEPLMSPRFLDSIKKNGKEITKSNSGLCYCESFTVRAS